MPNEIDFGTRKCLICQQEIPAQLFGRHIFAHSDREKTLWPGGSQGLLKSLVESLDESIRRAEGNEKVINDLNLSREAIKRFMKKL